MKKQLINFYLEYTNEYLTIEKVAEHNEIDIEDAKKLIELGRKYFAEAIELITKNIKP